MLDIFHPKIYISISRVTDEKYLQWQCKKTCNLCNTDPSTKEMDKICNAYLGPEIRAKYEKNFKTQKPKQTKPSKQRPNKDTSRPEIKRTERPTTTRPTTRRPATRRPKTKRPSKNKAKSKKGKGKPSSKKTIDKKTGKGKTKSNRKSGKGSRNESPRSSGGFVVVTDDQRRAELRSFWTRKG